MPPRPPRRRKSTSPPPPCSLSCRPFPSLTPCPLPFPPPSADRKLREAARRLDYVTRAVRIEELPIAQTRFDDRTATAAQRHGEEAAEALRDAEARWRADVGHRAGLVEFSVLDHMDEYEAGIMSVREAVHRTQCQQCDVDAAAAAQAGKRQRAEQRQQAEEDARRAEQER